MRIGPITIQWTSHLAQRAHEAQTLDLRRNRCIAGQSHDIQALRRTVGAMRLRIVTLEATQVYVIEKYYHPDQAAKGWDDETLAAITKELNP